MDGASADVERFSEEGTKLSDDGNHSEALQLFEKALSLLHIQTGGSTLLNGDRNALIDCFYNVGSCQMALEHYGDALTTMRKLESLLKECEKEDFKRTADSYYTIAVCCQETGKTTEAVPYLRKAADAYEKDAFQHQKESLQTYSLLAEVGLNEKVDTESLLHFLDKVIHYGKAEGANLEVALAYCQKGVILSGLDHRKGEGKDCLELARIECLKIEKGDKQAKAFGSIGSAYAGMEMRQLADTCFHQALKALRESENRDQLEEAILLQNIGAICNHDGQYKESIPYHSASSAAYDELGRLETSGNCQVNLAFAYTQLENYSEAEDALTQALHKASESGCKELECRAGELLGTVYFRQGKHGEALESFKRTLCAAGQVEKFTDDGLTTQTVSDRIVSKLTDVLETQQQLRDREAQGRASSSSSSSSLDRNGEGKRKSKLTKRRVVTTSATVYNTAEDVGDSPERSRSSVNESSSSSMVDERRAASSARKPPPERPAFQSRIESGSGLTVKDRATMESRLEYFKNYEGDSGHSTPIGQTLVMNQSLPLSPVVKEGSLAGEAGNYERSRSVAVAKPVGTVQMETVKEEEDTASVSTATTIGVKSKLCVIV